MKHTGETIAREVQKRIGLSLANAAALAAIPLEERVDGQYYKTQDGKQWIFSLASTATDATSQLVVTPTDVATGRFLRADPVVDLRFAFDFNMADANVIFTVPAGYALQIYRAYWDITTGDTSFTGGASSAIGLSSSNAAYNTKGDLLGGASGDVAAGLAVSATAPYRGTIGAKLASLGFVGLIAADTIRFDRITSAFTAGAGRIHVLAHLISNTGLIG